VAIVIVCEALKSDSDLPQIIDTPGSFRPCSALADCREQQRGQYPNDCHHAKQLDQSEGPGRANRSRGYHTLDNSSALYMPETPCLGKG
jgi:hypothetical protein